MPNTQDFLVATQTQPQTRLVAVGLLVWSCCGSMPTAGTSALAELILAPSPWFSRILTLFATVGLSPQTRHQS